MKTRTLVTLAVIAALAILAIAFVGYAVIHTTFSIPNRARVKGVGVGIFWDLNCTEPVAYIDWGTIEPNETKATLVYMRSRSNVNITLSLTTENWDPENATDYMTLSWNYTGAYLTPKSVTPVE